MADERTRVGLISDTHGLLRPEALSALRGVDLIVHAGDVGGHTIVDTLEGLAPVHAVRGNTDHDDWGRRLPKTEVVAAGGLQLYVLHDIDELDLDPRATGFAAVIYGHSHRPDVENRNGVVFVNPGSAGPRRFNLPVSVAIASIRNGDFGVELFELEV